MILSRKKTAKIAIYFLIILAATVFSYFEITQVILAQTTLNPATIGFNTIPFSFAFTKLAGTINSFSAYWNVQTNPGSSIGINCTFIGSSNKDCRPKPYLQNYSGSGSCSVENPPYNFTPISSVYSNYAASNNISCFVYNTSDITQNATYNSSFYPLAFNVSAALGSLTVGREVSLRVNVQNNGLLTDNYTVTVTSPSSYIDFSAPLTSTGFLQGSPTNEYGYSLTGVTALASFGTQTTIVIQVNSTVNQSIGQTITIQLTAGLASLPDFTILGIIQIIILAALILWAKK